MSDTVIEAIGLTMRFPQQRGWRSIVKSVPGKLALDGIDLEVQRGEIFGLLGPNGAGKTTLLKILSTLTIPTGGAARLMGHDVARESLAVRKRIGVVYGDERTFFWRLSALNNLRFYGSLHGLRGKETTTRGMELLKAVGLSGQEHVRMHHYSSGMKQRASIARGLLNRPDVLLMDEPTRALDPIGAGEIRELVRDMSQRAGCTVVIATNIMAEAESLCDRIAFINNGRIETIGEIAAIRRRLQVNEVHELTTTGMDAGELECLAREAGAYAVGARQDGVRVTLSFRAEHDSIVVPTVVRGIVEAGGDVWSCSQRALTMEEIFAMIVAGSSEKPVAVPV